MPDPVKDLQCVMKDGIATLQWHEPVRANGPIQRYLIAYVDGSISNLSIPNYVEPTVLYVAIEGVS